MKAHVHEQNGGAVVALNGDVDLQTSPEARRILLEVVSNHRIVVVDLSAVSYIDSSGIASLVEALQRGRQSGSRLALASVSEAALRVLQLAKLDKVFKIYPSVDVALADASGS